MNYVRYSLRTLRRTPGFTITTVLSLALGIGANTAIFSLIDTVMLRMLPVAEPERLVELLHRFPGEPRLNGYSWQRYNYFLEHNHVFSALIGAASAPIRGSFFNLRTAGAEPERVEGLYVTGNFFPVLGVKPALGRLISPDDDKLNEPVQVAVVSWSFWKNRYNLDHAILGKQIVIDDLPLTIVGVAGREFTGLRIDARQDVWVPLAIQPVMHPDANFTKNGLGLAVVGQLKPGVSMEQALAEMTVLFRRMVDEDKTPASRFMRAMTFELASAGTGLSLVRDQVGQPLMALMAVVGVLLVLACANVAGLLLARGAGRQREMALRLALGGSRFQLMRQALTESLILSAAGALLGIVLAYFGTGALLRILASGRNPMP